MKAVAENQLNLPPPASIQGIVSFTIYYYIVGDDAFLMSKHLMKLYPHRHLDKEKRVFNYRLSRARRVVENAFASQLVHLVTLINCWSVRVYRIQNLLLAFVTVKLDLVHCSCVEACENYTVMLCGLVASDLYFAGTKIIT
ncbi:Hypothetical predicted protein [Paramuricea clavata]|uniref:Uncharacterized protein n=1 Tax=Paramuricea clavata TaxID=317549 RepID=A0A7D9ICD4_PARCT|nr:Hypothetical predicted protein [Paramuricea clavata]